MTAPAADPRGGECTCPDPRLTLGENADVRYPVEFNPACSRHGTPPATGRGDTDSSGEAIKPGLSAEANARRLKWFTDAELAAELNRRRALDGA